ncbi:MAG: PqqD family protein [Candidatus Thermoplasmatota archaeon]|nr:PqqD family protein [Candidatus Thermoplasmatota archaeon]MBU4255624.1 PqqD family protein [Candidatus Thermoplasmatota archaeon]MCG2825686.1 PqqD family protein [Thermoplasmatales archaeon]
MNGEKLIRNKDSISRKIENEILVFNQISKQYYILNETAALVWELSDGQHTIDEIVRGVMDECVDAEAEIVRKDVIETVNGMRKLKILS